MVWGPGENRCRSMLEKQGLTLKLLLSCHWSNNKVSEIGQELEGSYIVPEVFSLV